VSTELQPVSEEMGRSRLCRDILNNLAANKELVFWSPRTISEYRSGDARCIAFFLLPFLLVHHVPAHPSLWFQFW